MSKWLRRICVYWNKIITYGENSTIYRMAVESASYAHGWARQVISALEHLGYQPSNLIDMSSQTLLPIDGEHAVCQANSIQFNYIRRTAATAGTRWVTAMITSGHPGFQRAVSAHVMLSLIHI